ncbi:MAG: HAD-IA family hydrolase [Candidatus Aenigmarchaeota archaeon]|nr:HAD-IA family hydrolase [Candidatus Aenigmarchaeota archaeon]
MIKAVIFDLGGVCFFDATQRVIDMLKSDYGVDEVKAYSVLSPKSEMGKLYRRGMITAKEFWTAALKELSVKENYDKFLKLWVDSPEMEGTVEIVRKLKQNGLKLFFLSDNIKERADILDKKFGVMKYFDGGIFSNLVGKIKPDGEDVFLMALDKTGEVAADVVFVDDKEKNVDTARGVGMKVIHFKNPAQLEKELKLLGVKF